MEVLLEMIERVKNIKNNMKMMKMSWLKATCDISIVNTDFIIHKNLIILQSFAH